MKTMMMAAVAASIGGMALADENPNDVKLQLQWVTQAQFAAELDAWMVLSGRATRANH